MLLGAGSLLLATALGLFLAFLPRPRQPQSGHAPPDPRRDYVGLFQNVNPAVQYVPDERCADCHEDKARSFAQHPMGRSLSPIARAAAPPEEPRYNNPFATLGSQFRVDHKEGRLWHRRTRLDPAGRPAAALEWEIDYALGSGTHGCDYLTDRDGYLFETPISWFSQKQVWDLSPGFGQTYLTGRAISPDCLFCHANRAHHVEGSTNHYRKPVFDGYAIGCQRCHGPGELHVARRQGLEPGPDEVDYTIVNPRHLEPSLREAVCEQCHLQGKARVVRRGREVYDFRPGLPLELFWSVFVGAAGTKESRKAVGHVEQMYQSRCFQGGHGLERLGCVSCHDPHEYVPPPQRVAHYRSRCLQCHRDDLELNRQGDPATKGQKDKKSRRVAALQPCSLPAAERLKNRDSCIDCHMPPYGSSDIPHTASTDHRILKNAATGSAEPESHPALRSARAVLRAGDGLPLTSFYDGGKEAGDEEEIERDRALALVKLAFGGDASASRAIGSALPALESALQRDPDDRVAGQAKGHVLALQNRMSEALAAFEDVLAKAPNQELSLVGAAIAAEELRKAEAAESYWRRSIAANPWEPGYRRNLVLLLIKKEAWDEARPECQAWVRLDPLSAEARAARVSCLLAAGNKDEARAEFARIEALAPSDLAELRIRFDKKLK